MSSRRPVALTSPGRIFADIGRTTPITLFLTELAGTSRDVIVRALGNLSGPLPAAQVHLEAGATVEVVIDVAIPHGMPPGQHNFLFEAVDRDTGSVIDSLETSVDVQHTKAIRMQVSPASIRRRRRGRIRIIVRNHDDETQHIRLRAETDDHETSVSLEKPDVSVRPGELVRVSGRVKAKAFYIGKQKERWYSIIGDGAGTPIYTRGNVRQMPMIGKNIKGVMVLLTILMVWAGSTLAVIRLVSPATTESTAGASGAPVDGGDAGDQDGAGAAGAEPILVDVTGTVTAVPDGSGVVVSWRTVSLGDSATDGKVAAGTSTPSPDVALQQTETDETGAFVVAGIDALGLYEFSFFKAGHQTKTLIVQPNGQPVTLEVTLEAGSGFIGGSTVDPSGNPLGGVDATLTDGAITYSLSTPTSGDGAGRFSFANLSSPATYVLDAKIAGRGLASTTIDLATGQSIGDVRLVLSPDVATLAGKITSAAFEAGSTAAADFRVAQETAGDLGPTFTITATDGSLTRSTTTLTEGLLAGTFRLEQLPVGRTYTITYEAPGFQTLTEQIVLTIDTPEREISMVRSTGRLRGKVTISGSSLSPTAVAVTVTNPDNTYKSTDAISSDGSLLVDGIVPGAYVVVFEALGLEKQVREVDIGAGTSTELNVTMSATRASPVKSSLSFKVIKGGNDTTTQVTATLKFRAAGDCGAVEGDTDCEYLVTLADGNVKITDLEAGGYVVDFTAPGFAPRRISAQVAASTEAPQQEVIMIPLGSLQGLVADETSAPIQGLQLGLYLGSTLIAATTTEATGEYLFSRKLLPETYSVKVTGAGFLPVERSVVGALAATLNLDITVRGKSLITGEVRSLDLLTGNYVAVEPRDYGVFIRQNKAPSNNQWLDAATLGVAETLGAYRMALEPTQDASANPVVNDPPYDLCVVVVTQPDTPIDASACSATVAGLTARTSSVIDIELGETLTRSFYFSPDPGNVTGSVTVGGAPKGGVKVEARRVDETGRVLESSTALTEDGLVNGNPDPNEVVGRFVFTSLTPVKALPTPAPPPGTAVGDETACTFGTGGSCWVIRASEEGTGFADSAQLTVYPARGIDITSNPINIVKAGGTYNVTFTDDRGDELVGVTALVYDKNAPPNPAWDGTCTGRDVSLCKTSTNANRTLSFPGLDPKEYTVEARLTDYRNFRTSFTITQGGVVDQVHKLSATKGDLQIDVRDASGSPIGGAEVWIGADFATATFKCSTNTADDQPVSGLDEGTCLISGLSEGVVTLSVSATGSPTGTLVATVIGGQRIGASIVLGSNQATLLVATFSTTGTPLSTVDVTIDNTNFTCRTGQNGECQIPGVSVGSFVRVTATKTGYRTTSANVAIGSGTTGLSLALVPTRTLAITVTGDRIDLEGVAVTAVDANGDVYACAAPGTDANGECSIDNLPLGTVVVTASLPGWVTQSTSFGITSAATSSLTFDLVPAVATLSGKVSSGGSDVPGATVVATNSSGASLTTVTDSSGNYVFSRIAAGTWTLTVSAVGYALSTTTGVTVTAAQTTSQNVSLSSLDGRLEFTIKTSTGSPVSGIVVTLSSVGNPSATSDANGLVAFTGIAPGSYTVTVADGTSPARFSGQSFVVNVERDYTTRLPVYLGSTRSVVVIGIAGIPASGFGPQSPLDVKVRATDSNNNSVVVRAVTQFDRSLATFTDLSAGSYTIEIDHVSPGDLTTFTARSEIVFGTAGNEETYSVGSARTVQVNQASTNDAGLWLLAKTTVDVQVPVNVDGATVELSDGYLLSPVSVVSTSGAATLTSVPPGTYTLFVSKAGYVSSATTVSVGDKSVASNGVVTLAPVTLSTSTAPGTLTATVTDNANPAVTLSGATVTVVETGQSCVTSNSGVCTIVTPPGSYTVRATHPSHTSGETATPIVVSPGLTSTTSFALSAASTTGAVTFTVTDGTAAVQNAPIRNVASGNSCSTDANGECTFNSLSTIDTTFEIAATGFGTVFVTVKPTAGGTAIVPIRLVATPTPTNSLSVTTVDARTGAALPDVTVTRSDGTSLCSAVTDANGHCSPAAALPTGSLSVKATKTGHVTTSVTVAITTGASTSLVIAMQPSRSALDVRVRDSRDGSHLQGATVTFTGASGAQCGGSSTTTDSDGICAITGLEAGPLTITISKTNFATLTAVVTLDPGQRTSLDVTLSARGTLTVSLGAAPASSTTFTISGTSLSCEITAPATSCTISSIPVGTWILTSSTPGTYANRTVYVALGASNTVSYP